MEIKQKEFCKEVNSIKSINLICKSSTNVLEKILWTLMMSLGIGWACYFIPEAFDLWIDNPSMITIKNLDLNQLDYPAITILSKESTKYAVAERFGNYLDPKLTLPDQLTKLRNVFLKCATIYNSGTYYGGVDEMKTKTDKDYFTEYENKCWPLPGQFGKVEDSIGCKVLLKLFLDDFVVL